MSVKMLQTSALVLLCSNRLIVRRLGAPQRRYRCWWVKNRAVQEEFRKWSDGQPGQEIYSKIKGCLQYQHDQTIKFIIDQMKLKHKQRIYKRRQATWSLKSWQHMSLEPTWLDLAAEEPRTRQDSLLFSDNPNLLLLTHSLSLRFDDLWRFPWTPILYFTVLLVTLYKAVLLLNWPALSLCAFLRISIRISIFKPKSTNLTPCQVHWASASRRGMRELYKS